MASRVVEEAQHKDVALQRAHDAENELKRKIAWLENNVTNNYKHLEAENRSLQAQLDAACQERQQRIEAVERAEADFMRARAEASRLEKHAADLHNQIAQVREEALQHQDGSKLRYITPATFSFTSFFNPRLCSGKACSANPKARAVTDRPLVVSRPLIDWQG